VTTFATRRLCVRPLRAEDLPAFVAYRRDPVVARYQSWDGAYSMQDAEELIAERHDARFGGPGWLQLAIVERESARLCGDCAVRGATDEPATAEIAVTLAPCAQGTGVATEALEAVLGGLFERGFHRVFAQTDDRNHAMQRLLDRLGFRCEARLVEADWFKGEWTTLRVYAILAREWHARVTAG
jgi:RimJ/RimL family protein N-acetyltransferase